MDNYGLNYPAHECHLKKKMKYIKEPSALEKFKNQLLISDKNVRGNWCLRSKGSIILELLRHKSSKYWYIVHPFSRYRLYWECFMVILFVFSLVFSPFRGCFLNAFMAKYNRHFKRSQCLIVYGLMLEFALNMIFIMDSAGMFFTGYYLPEAGYTELNPRKLFKRHIYSFIIDVLAYTSVDSWIIFIWGIDTYSQLPFRIEVVLQALNLVQFIRFRTYIIYCYSYRKFKIFGQIRIRLLILLLLYFLTLHWTVYFVLIIPEMTNGDSLYLKFEEKPVSWIQRTDFLKHDIQDQYFIGMIKAMHFIHFGTAKDWEKMYSFIDYFCGIAVAVGSVVFWLFLIAYLTEVIAADNVLTMKINFVRKQLKKYMKWKDLPKGLKKRLHRFYMNRFLAHYFSNEETLVRLTDSLKQEIGLYISHKLFYDTDVFQTVPKNVMARLVLKMHQELYYPNDIIIQGRTFGDCMYFISSGTVSVSTTAEKEISLLKDGDFFGEIALIAQNRRRTATVTAVTITEVYRLESLDFDVLADEFPNVYAKFEKIALERYNMIRSTYRKES